MRKYVLVFLIFLTQGLSLFAKNNNVNESLLNGQDQAIPWTVIPNWLNTTTVYAQVKKDGVLFQPTGVLLGAFLDGICKGYIVLSTGPGGIKLHQLNVGFNDNPTSGIELRVYDPTTEKIYRIAETITCTVGVKIGKINIPVIYNIAEEIVTDVKPIETVQLNVYPNPIESQMNISLNSEFVAQANVAIYSLQGSLIRTVYNGSVDGVKVLSVQRGEDFPNGLYLLNAKIGDQQYIQKLIFK
jgi:hypothetical protein